MVYIKDSIGIISAIADIPQKLQEANKKILAVILLNIGGRASFMIKSIVHSMSKIKPISKEGLASITFVKDFITNDLPVISIAAVFSNVLLTLFSKSGFGKKLERLFNGIIGATEIVAQNKTLMDEKSRKNLFSVFHGVAESLLKFVTDMNTIDKKLGTLKNQEALNKKIEKIKDSVYKIVSMLTEVGDDTALITGATYNLERINGGIRGIIAMVTSLTVVAAMIPLASLGMLFIKGVLTIFKLIGTFAHSAKRGSSVIKSIGYSLVIFSGSALLFTLMIGKIAPKFIMGLALVGLAALTFYIIGMGHKAIEHGAKAMLWVAVGMTAFAVASYLLGFAIVSNPIGIIGGLALFGLTALMFMVIGEKSKHIREGAFNTLIMSVALFFFAGSMWILGETLKKWNIEMMAMYFGLLAGTLFIFDKVGGSKKTQDDIKKGAMGMLYMSGALIAFAVGIAAYGLALNCGILKWLLWVLLCLVA